MSVKVTRTSRVARTSVVASGPRAPRTEGPVSLDSIDRLVALRREIDGLVDSFFQASPFASDRWHLAPFRRLEKACAPHWRFSPRVEVSESENAYTVSARLPGMAERDLQVVLVDDTLTLKGETREDARAGKEERECRFASFRRSFAIPDGVDQDRIAADFDHGVLTVVLPKREAVQPKRVEIRMS
jgi:HSP20 family protein